MTTAEQLATFVTSLQHSSANAEVVETVRMHVYDTIGAAYAGSQVADTPPVRDLVVALAPQGPGLAVGQSVYTTPALAALLGCVAARCTEVDDIHIGSCVTPGAVIVPAVVATSGLDDDDRGFLAAFLAGYEVLIRFGLAVDGPHILYKSVWPTYLAAGFGTAAAVGSVIGLTADQLAHAFAIVATLATGTVGGRVSGLTSRWFILGCAVQSAVTAALAAARGMQGDLTLLDGRWSEITGIALDRAVLTSDLGARFHLAETSFKPICAAKQTIAAVYALRSLLEEERLTATDVRHVLVEVPQAYKAMIDQPDLPRNRMASIANVRYQLALAALAPDELLDVARADVRTDEAMTAFAKSVEVRADERLDALFPQSWPARVTVTDAAGRRIVKELQHPLGDPGTPYGWQALEKKFARVASAVDPAQARGLADTCRSLGEPGSARALLRELGQA